MRCVCYVCGKQYGEKEPLDNKDETSGLCPVCYPKELEAIDKYIKDQIAKATDKKSR